MRFEYLNTVVQINIGFTNMKITKYFPVIEREFYNSIKFQIRSHEDVENKTHKLTFISNYYDEHT